MTFGRPICFSPHVRGLFLTFEPCCMSYRRALYFDRRLYIDSGKGRAVSTLVGHDTCTVECQVYTWGKAIRDLAPFANGEMEVEWIRERAGCARHWL